jgi:tetratricopeptide (TPR) repeat protein
LRGAASTFLKELDVPAAAREILLNKISDRAEKTSCVAETENGVFSFYASPALVDDDPDVMRELETANAGIAAVRARGNLALAFGRDLVDRRRYNDNEALGGALDSYYTSKGITGTQSASGTAGGWTMALVWAAGETSGVFKKVYVSSEDINEKYCELLYGTAKKEFDAGRYGKALVVFKQIHDLKWSNIGLYLDTSECFIKTSGEEDARELLAELVSVLGDKMSSDDYARAGTLFRAAGDRKSALSSFKKARELYRQGK